MSNQKFSDTFHIDNRDNFKKLWLEKKEDMFRESVKEYLLEKKESDFLDFSEFRKSNKISEEDFEIILKKIIQELENLGWFVQKIFGETCIMAGTKEEILNSHWAHEIV